MKKLAYICLLSAAITALSLAPVCVSASSQDENTESSEESAAAVEESVDGGEESYAQAVSDSQTLDACYTLALNAINAGNYETAKDYLSVCFGYCDPASNPDIYADLLLKQACINSIEEKNDLALRNLDAALRIKPDLADAYLVRTDVQVALGNVDKAIKDLETYIELTEDTSMYATVAQLQEALGDIEAAQSAYDKYVEGTDGEVEEAGFQTGLYRMQSGKYEEAIEAFETYREDETYGAGALYNIGVCKMNMGDYAGAVEAFTDCEEKDGDFNGLYYNRGVCHLLSSEWEAAAADFETSIESEPYVEDATYDLGICQMQQEDLETAINTFTAYIDSVENPEEETEEGDGRAAINYGAYYYRAVCQELLGNLEEALADYTVCIDNGYELTQSYYERAQVYAALGDTENQNADLGESLKYAN